MSEAYVEVLKNMRDEDIDDREIPRLTEKFFRQAMLKEIKK